MPNQYNIHAKTGPKNKPSQARKTAKSASNYTPNQAQTTRQIRLKLHAKSGSNCTPNQAQTARQIRLKLHAKSGSNRTPNQAQTTRQIRLKLRAKLNQAPNTCCMLQVRSKKERKETRTRLSFIENFAAQKRQLT